MKEWNEMSRLVCHNGYSLKKININYVINCAFVRVSACVISIMCGWLFSQLYQYGFIGL